ncbi:hypothetical protein GTP55_25740 [Duganella sp. FT109W]|uniref:Uncharacterized protein n=1 Tax=Duganella margarita TaxID=2692170 RepID=A0ABW9WNE8_9BURK|nr:hypothetical protein [Duganella margarita]MYN42751.1 hypothetical protein [Duganella margarita]
MIGITIPDNTNERYTIFPPPQGKVQRIITIHRPDVKVQSKFWEHGQSPPLAFKKIKQDRIPRRMELVLEFDRKYLIEYFRIDRFTQEIQIFGKPKITVPGAQTQEIIPIKSILRTMYGKRSMSRLFFYNERPTFSYHTAFQKYDFIYGIDTNKREYTIEKKAVYYTAVAEYILNSPDDHEFKILPDHCNMKANLIQEEEINSELVSIFFLIQSLSNSATSKTKNFLIFTDSDLGKIDGINQRAIPLFLGLFLPPNFKLAYASAERGKAEFPINKMLKMCDDHANHMAATESVQTNDYPRVLELRQKRE